MDLGLEAFALDFKKVLFEDINTVRRQFLIILLPTLHVVAQGLEFPLHGLMILSPDK